VTVNRSSDPSIESSFAPENLKTALELWSQAEGDHSLPVVGGSMLPLLQEGDWVRVIPAQAAQVGQIVVFQQSGGLLIHRVIHVKVDQNGNKVLFTKGDRVRLPDLPLKPSEMLGRVVAIRRGQKELNLETHGWQRVEKAVAGLMWFQSDLQSAGTLSGGSSLSGYLRLSLSRAVLLFGRFFLVTSERFIGKWVGEQAHPIDSA
jgi:signal peptidase I